MTTESTPTERQPRSQFATVAANLFMGGFSGAVGALTVYPGDLVKTRLQAPPPAGMEPYKGALDVFKRTLKSEGITGFYRGVPPVILGKTPEKALNLAANDFFRTLFQVTFNQLTLPMEVVAGALAGATQVTLTNPYEIVKVRMQTSEQSLGTVVSRLGFGGLYRGVSATLARDVPFAAIYFTLFSKLKASFADQRGHIGSSQLFMSGLFSGIVAAGATCPCDVIKTRLQVAGAMSGGKRLNFFQMLPVVVRQEGARALIKGLGPRVAIIGPQFGVTMFVYTRLKRLAGTEEGVPDTPDAQLEDFMIKVEPIDMRERVAIVTGASEGIGRATAEELALRGATVVMACRDMDKCEEVRRRISRKLKEATLDREDAIAAAKRYAMRRQIMEEDPDFKDEDAGDDVERLGPALPTKMHSFLYTNTPATSTSHTSTVKVWDPETGSATVAYKTSDAPTPVTGTASPESEFVTPGTVECMPLELSSFDSIRQFANRFNTTYPNRLALLVNNAATFWDDYALTQDKLETTFQVNFVSHFLLTNLLLPNMARCVGGARVINVTSEAHRNATTPLSLTSRDAFKKWDVYCSSKLAQVIFTNELQRRVDLARLPISVAAVHPGATFSRLYRRLPSTIKIPTKPIRRLFWSTARTSGSIVADVATCNGVSEQGGRYFVGKTEQRASELAYDSDTAERFWEFMAFTANLSPEERELKLKRHTIQTR